MRSSLPTCETSGVVVLPLSIAAAIREGQQLGDGACCGGLEEVVGGATDA